MACGPMIALGTPGWAIANAIARCVIGSRAAMVQTRALLGRVDAR